jgi:hypothetical protein
MNSFVRLMTIVILILNARSVYAQGTASSNEPPVSGAVVNSINPNSETPANEHLNTSDGIPVGTKITSQNWRNYTAYMPEGMIALFQGQYYWKMPSDIQMEIGPAILRPLPKNYLESTEKYSSQLSLVELPTGGLNLRGYSGGAPFPDPQEPHRGWKVLADVWYRYIPHLIVDSYGTTCTQNSMGNVSCSSDVFVARQLSFNTDPGVPSTIPGAEGKYYTEWFMTLEPENERYNASLVISYTDLSKPQDIYAFIPSLRRSQAVSSSARCSTFAGTDFTPDEYRYGFNANLTQMKVDFVAEKKILALVDAQFPTGAFPDGYIMPLGWPQPSWGKWQVRDASVISVSKVPSEATGYCYGKRVMYVDKASSATLWLDLYDKDMKYWKFGGFLLKTLDVPGVGPVTSSGAAVELMYDMQNKHASYFSDPGLNRPFYVNDQAPNEYFDVTRFTTSTGLNEIMR